MQSVNSVLLVDGTVVPVIDDSFDLGGYLREERRNYRWASSVEDKMAGTGGVYSSTIAHYDRIAAVQVIVDPTRG